MIKEENNLDIQNIDGYLDIDEENLDQQGMETFSVEEENICDEEYLVEEENDEHLDNTKQEKVKSNNSNNPSTTSASNAFFGTIAAVASSIAIIGAVAGLIPSIKTLKVDNFLSRSTMLGFEVRKDSSKNYIMELHNDSFSRKIDVMGDKEYLFKDLNPNTVYYLDLYDTSSGTSVSVYSANYMTKTVDEYTAGIDDIELLGNFMVNLHLSYEGKDIGFVTVDVCENGENILLYEGAPKEVLNLKVNDENSYFTCKIYVNGVLTNFIEMNEPVDPTPSGHVHNYTDWLYEDGGDTHWKYCRHHDCEGIKYFEEEHDFVKVDEYESIYDTLYRCSVCGCEKHVEKVPVFISYELNETQDGYVLTGYDKDRYSEYTDGVNLVIPSEYEGLPVVEIAEGALKENRYIESIVIPDTVTKIGAYAFEYLQNVRTIFVPDSVTSIGEGAFRDCLVLEELTIPFVGGEVSDSFDETSFFGYIFGVYSTRDTFNTWGTQIRAESSDGSIKTEYYIPNSLVKLNITGNYEMYESVLRGIMYLKEINITGEITEIPDYLFADILDSSRGFATKLDAIYLPDTITSIGKYVFADLQELEEIHYAGTMDEWNAITKDSDWNSNTDSYSGTHTVEKVICSDGDINIE